MFLSTCLLLSSSQAFASELSPELTEAEIARMEQAMATQDMPYIERKIAEIKIELLRIENDLSNLKAENFWNHVTDALIVVGGLVVAFLALALTVVGFKLLATAATAIFGVAILVGLLLTAVIGWNKPLLSDIQRSSKEQIKEVDNRIYKKKVEAFELREELESLQAEFCQNEDFIMLPECSSR